MARKINATISQKDFKFLIDIFEEVFSDFNRAARKPPKGPAPEEKAPENFWSQGTTKISYASVTNAISRKQAQEEAERVHLERIGDLHRFAR